MPFGVSKDFLGLARDGQRRALYALGPLVLLGAAGWFVAELLDEPRNGAFVRHYLGSVLAGLALGALAGWFETRAWGESLKKGWSAWMHSAVGAGTMAEAAHRAGALHLRPWRTLAVVLVVLNGACLVASWSTLPPYTLVEAYGILTIGTVTVTGVALGAYVAVRAAEALWCRAVENQTLALVREGRLGVWGIR